jgi:GLPGLI family protein
MYAVVPRIASGNASQQLIEEYRKTQPQFLQMTSVLAFTRNNLLFKPEQSVSSTNSFNNNPVVTQNNIVFTDVEAKKSITQKNVIGTKYLVKDNIPKIRWKITNDTREIAGYICKRANGIILDSIYVVAFYTGDIPVSGGPESFGGLPGMILQLTLPHENITWSATKVTGGSPVIKEESPPGIITTRVELTKNLTTILQRYGAKMQVYMKALLL